jgi:hypothetical protein
VVKMVVAASSRQAGFIRDPLRTGWGFGGTGSQADELNVGRNVSVSGNTSVDLDAIWGKVFII